jgi:hypothetical protein
MRTYFLKCITIAFFSLLDITLFSQELSVSSATATAAANALVGPGITVSGATFTGDVSQLNFVYDGPGNIGINSGILLTTGKGTYAQGVNHCDAGGHSASSATNAADVDLYTLQHSIGNYYTQKPPAVLEFDFTTSSLHPSFEYVFLSEEYNNYVNTGFNDAFGFFISGPGINGPYSNNAINIAVLPGTTIPVSVNTINLCSHPNLYHNNCYGNPSNICTQDGNPSCPAQNNSLQNHDIIYNGYTVVLSALIDLPDCNTIQGATYHAKIVIANFRDDGYDSGVILKSNSFVSGLNAVVTAAPQPVCEGNDLTLSVAPCTGCTYLWSTGGTTYQTTVTASSSDNPYSVTVTNQDGCQTTGSVDAIIHTPQNVAPFTNGVNNTGQYIVYMQPGQQNDFNIPTFDTWNEDVIFDLCTNLPSGATFTHTFVGQEIGHVSWNVPPNTTGSFTFAVNYADNNACDTMQGHTAITIRIGCPSCVGNIYYENRTQGSNPLPAFTKAGDEIIAGTSVDPSQTDGPVETGSASVVFKAGVEIDLEPGFVGGPGYVGYIDPNTCITDCEDCCEYFTGFTFDPIPNAFTPNGDPDNEFGL